MLAFASHERIPYTLVLVHGFCSEGIYLVLALEVLFQPITLEQLRQGSGPPRFGAAAVLSFDAKTLLVLALMFWGLSNLGSNK